ncbi:Lipid A export ATP-binding/permease protein MsbA [compost metagenome]
MKLFNLCRPFLFGERKRMFIYIGLTLFSSIIGVIFPMFTGSFIDVLVIGNDITYLFKYCFVLILLSGLNVVLGYATNILYAKIQSSAGYNFNTYILNHVKKLPLRFFKNQNTVYLNQRINNDANNIIIFCINIISNLIINLIIIGFTFVILFKSNYKIALLLMVLIVIYATTYKYLRKPLFRRSMEHREAQNIFFATLNDQLINVGFIKSHSANNLFEKRLSASFQTLLNKVLSYQRMSYIFTGFDSITSTLAQVLIYILGGIEVFKGNLTIGFFTVLINYFNMLMGSTRYFFNLGKNYQDSLVSYERIMELLNKEVPLNGDKIIDNIDVIEIKDLSFKYEGNYIVEKLSLEFRKGIIYCISGENGSGKSTIINLILGLHISEYTGEILYNGYNINDINLDYTRLYHIGFTEQEPVLFEDSIINNIIMGKQEELFSSKIEMLITYFNMDEYMTRQPDGLYTIINDQSNNLSGGEKQKLSIIRQLLKNPDIMIFDEPSSALDISSTISFMNYINKIKSNKIIIIVSHDEIVLEMCDEVVEIHHSSQSAKKLSG